MTDLRIRRIDARYRVARADTERVRATLDRVATELVPQALDALLPDVLARLGLSEQAEIVVRRVDVRLRVAELDAAAVGAAWAQAIAEAVVRVAADRPQGGGDDLVAVYPSRAEAELAWLVALAEGRASDWWWPVMLAEQGRLPGPGPIVAGWIRTAPEATAGRLARLVFALGPGPVTAQLPDRVARALLDGWTAAWGQRAHLLTQSAGGSVLAEEGRALGAEDALGADPLGACAAPRAATVPVGPAGAELARSSSVIAQLLAALSPAAARALRALPAGAAGDLLAVALVWSEQPAADLSLPAQRAELRRLAALLAPPVLAQSEDTAPAADGPLGAAETTRTTRSVSVSAGGLLFLIRATAGLPLVLEHRSVALQARLYALGTLVLDRVLAPLPVGRQRQIRQADQDLLRVFCGLPCGLSWGELAAAPLQELAVDPSVIADADEALAALVALLPDAVAPAARALELLLGPHQHAVGDDQRLACLVLRPGRLILSETHATLALSSDTVDTELRRGGWDLDPGWVPWLGRVIRFTYQAGPGL